MSLAPNTIYTYALNGTTRDFAIPFEYLARRFVTISLIGTNRRELVLNTDYRFVSKSIIQTTIAWSPGDGYETLEVRRNTSATDRLVDFADGSILRAYELNISQVQTLHVAEEARNMVADTIGVNNEGDLDARGRKITNVADAVLPSDAVSLRQVTAWSDGALVSRNAAKASEDAAKASEIASKASEDAAKASEIASKASEDAARTSALGMVESREASAVSAAIAVEKAGEAIAAQVLSTQAASNAQAYEQSASTSASTASSSAASSNSSRLLAADSASVAVSSSVTAVSAANRAEQVEARVVATTTMDFLTFELSGPNLIAHFMGYGAESQFTINAKGELEVIL